MSFSPLFYVNSVFCMRVVCLLSFVDFKKIYPPKKYLAPSTPIFKNLNILKFEKLLVQRISLMLFKFNIGEVPKPISDLLMVNRFLHNHNTRSVGYHHTPLARSEASYRSYI